MRWKTPRATHAHRPCCAERRSKASNWRGRVICRSAGLAQHDLDMLPVYEIIEPRLKVLRTCIAIVDIVAVLPHIHAQDRDRAVHERVFPVRRLLHLELA